MRLALPAKEPADKPWLVRWLHQHAKTNCTSGVPMRMELRTDAA